MKFCPECEIEYSSDDDFCAECGKGLEATASKDAEKPKDVSDAAAEEVDVVKENFAAKTEETGNQEDVTAGKKFSKKMWMIAVAVAILAVIAGVALAQQLNVSDAEIAHLEPSRVAVTEPNENLANDSEEVVQEAQFVWVLEPSIEADDVNYVRHESMDFLQNETKKQFLSSYAVMRRGDTFGIIDNDGSMKGGMDYSYAAYLWDGSIFMPLIEPDEPFLDLHALTDGELVPFGEWGGPPRPSVLFYYSQGLQRIVISRYYNPSADNSPSVPIALALTDTTFEQSNANMHDDWALASEWHQNNAGRFGIFSQGQMVTDFIYSNAGSWSSGLIAVEKDGRWGYLNASGEVVIPVEYDSSWSYLEFVWDTMTFEYIPSAFSASEGFVPLVKNGAWEMRDVKGNLVISPGIFDAIRPVYEGRSWVNQDGLWGIIEITADVPEVAHEYVPTEEQAAGEGETRRSRNRGMSEEEGFRLAEQGDFSFFAGRWVNGWGNEVLITPDGSSGGGLILDGFFPSRDGVYEFVSFHNEQRSRGDAGFAFPTGVETDFPWWDYVDAFPTDTSRVRLWIGDSFPQDINEFFYRR